VRVGRLVLRLRGDHDGVRTAAAGR